MDNKEMIKKYKEMIELLHDSAFCDLYSSDEIKDFIKWYLTLPENKQNPERYQDLLKAHYRCQLSEKIEEDLEKSRNKRYKKRKLKNGEPLSEDEEEEEEGSEEEEEDEEEEGSEDEEEDDEQAANDEFCELTYDYHKEIKYAYPEELLAKMKNIAAGRDEYASDGDEEEEEEELKHKEPKSDVIVLVDV